MGCSPSKQEIPAVTTSVRHVVITPMESTSSIHARKATAISTDTGGQEHWPTEREAHPVNEVHSEVKSIPIEDYPTPAAASLSEFDSDGKDTLIPVDSLSHIEVRESLQTVRKR